MLTLEKTKQYERKTVNSYNLDGSLRRSWKASLVSRDDSMLVLYGIFEKRVEHPLLGIIPAGTGSFEFYWLERWFNVFCFLTLDASLRNYYCNIAAPPIVTENALSFVDYEIDVLVTDDKKARLVDLQDYATEDKAGRYDLETKAMISKELLDLMQNIKNGNFPFNFTKHLSPYLELLSDE